MTSAGSTRTKVRSSFDDDLAAAFPAQGDADEQARHALLARLHSHYLDYMAGPEYFRSIPRLDGDAEITAVEDAWIRWEDAQVDDASLPVTAGEFADWFLSVAGRHTQPEFCRYLAEQASTEEIALFFLSEELVDSKFDDLVALVQIGTQGQTKLTIAENYWDEMGEGDLAGVHTRLFEHSAVFMRDVLARAGRR